MNEKVLIHGMSKSRYRCPECNRGLLQGYHCAVHGAITPLDITKASEGEKRAAIILGILEYVSNHEGEKITAKKIHEDTGLDENYFKKIMMEKTEDTDLIKSYFKYEIKPLNAQEVKERVLPFITRHCNSDSELNTSTLEKNFTNEEINLMFETGFIYEPVMGTVKAT